MAIYGIDYSNFPSPFYQEGSNYREKGECNLFPYLAIRGSPLFKGDNSLSKTDNGRDAVYDGCNRFLINISPLDEPSYPNSGSLRSLCNLDTSQIYAPNPKTDTKNYNYGAPYSSPSPNTCSPFYFEKYGGVYDNPVPIRGAPVEFKKVYFRGKLVDREKGYDLDSESETGCRTFHAVFACSNPIEQTLRQDKSDCDEPEGTLYNSRDENFAHSDYATERSWDEIDIFCGEGGGESSSHCSFQFNSYITGTNYQIACSPGTVNGLLPSNFDSVAQIPTGSNENKYIYLDIDTDGKNITSVSFEVSSSASSTSIRANEGGAQDNLKILAGVWIDKSLTSILCNNISICPEHVFSEDDPSNPYFPKRWYQWRIDSY